MKVYYMNGAGRKARIFPPWPSACAPCATPTALLPWEIPKKRIFA